LLKQRKNPLNTQEILNIYKKNPISYSQYDILKISMLDNHMQIFNVLINDEKEEKIKKNIIYTFILMLYTLGKINIIDEIIKKYNINYKNIKNKKLLQVSIQSKQIESVKHIINNLQKINLFIIDENLVRVSILLHEFNIFKIIYNEFKKEKISNYIFSNLVLNSGDSEAWDIFNFLVLEKQFDQLPKECLNEINESFKKNKNLIKNISSF
jgi:hypothetical protein